MRRAALATLGLALAFVWPASVTVGRAQRSPRVSAALVQQAQANGTVRVIVSLDVAMRPEGALTLPERESQRETIAAASDSLVADLPAAAYRSVRQFTTVPFVALDVSPTALAALEQAGLVHGVTEDRLHRLSLAESVPVVQGPQAWSFGATGAGWSVAVLDTGVDKAHPFLSSKVIEEACYSGSGDCPNGLTSQVGAGSGVPCTWAPSACRHGTHVAGIAAGQGSTFSGVARGASLISVRVFSRLSGSDCQSSSEDPCAMAYTSDLIAGLERVYLLRTTRQIASVNMSLGGGKYTSQASCDAENAGVKAAIDNLRTAGIATVVSAGNAGYSDGLAGPACISTAVSVGATTKTDQVPSFSNSAGFLQVLAPGSSIYSSVPGGGFAYFTGTSMAAPHVAGAWAVAKQQMPGASVSTLLSMLRTGGTWITDPRNGVSVPRLAIATALGLTGSAPSAFNKALPGGGATGQSTTPTLTWGTSAGATGYQFCIDATNDGACSAWVNMGTATSVQPTLAAGTTYYWHVRAINAVGTTYANGGSAAFWAFTTAPVPAGDSFEPDNTSGQASLTVAGAPQAHTFHVNGDVDWARFSAIAGQQYTMSTHSLGTGVDTVMSLYGTDGVTVLATNDNGGGGLSSRIVYTAAVTGTYYVRVAQFGGQGTGAYAVTLEAPALLRGDFNGDGKSDIVLQRTDGSTAVWLMNGHTVSNGGVLLGAGTGWGVRQIGDFNGDGKSDIVWQHTDGRSAMWLMNGLSMTSGGGLTGPGTGWVAVRSADFNGDGKSDIVWQHADGSAALWLMNGLNVASGGSLLGPGTGWTVREVGNFNGDGRSDLFLQHTNGSAAIWLMNGLSLTSGGVLLGPGTGWSLRLVGDFNGDGKGDLVWQHTDGSSAMWLMNGLSMTSGGALTGPGTGWMAVRSADFNADGKSDLVWRHADGRAALWLMNGLGISSGGSLLGPGTGWSVRQAGDFNGDGKNDLLWQHTDGSSAMWLMNGLVLTSGGGLLGPGTGWSPVP